jgi:hypothetical protein
MMHPKPTADMDHESSMYNIDHGWSTAQNSSSNNPQIYNASSNSMMLAGYPAGCFPTAGEQRESAQQAFSSTVNNSVAVAPMPSTLFEQSQTRPWINPSSFVSQAHGTISVGNATETGLGALAGVTSPYGGTSYPTMNTSQRPENNQQQPALPNVLYPSQGAVTLGSEAYSGLGSTPASTFPQLPDHQILAILRDRLPSQSQGTMPLENTADTWLTIRNASNPDPIPQQRLHFQGSLSHGSTADDGLWMAAPSFQPSTLAMQPLQPREGQQQEFMFHNVSQSPATLAYHSVTGREFGDWSLAIGRTQPRQIDQQEQRLHQMLQSKYSTLLGGADPDELLVPPAATFAPSAGSSATAMDNPQSHEDNQQEAILQKMLQSQLAELSRLGMTSSENTWRNLTSANQVDYSAPHQQHASFLSKMIPAEASSAKKQTRKPKKNRPKRPLTAYNLYFKEERGNLLAERAHQADDGAEDSPHTSEGTKRKRRKTPHGKIGFEEMAKTIAKRWKGIDSERLARYQEQAGELKRQYKEEVAKLSLKEKEEKSLSKPR